MNIKGVGVCGKGEPRDYYVFCPVCGFNDKHYGFYCDLCGKFIQFGENITCATVYGQFRNSVNHFHTDCIKKDEITSDSGDKNEKN